MTDSDTDWPGAGRSTVSVNVDRVIDEARVSAYQLRLFALCILVGVLDGIA